jgi:glucokinase
VGAQAKQAGPGLDREASFPVSLEAAGPASPRLIIEEVKTHLGDGEAEVTITLALGPQRFIGSAAGRAGERQAWELAAAASAAAIQQYLHHLSLDPSTPQVQLLDIVAFATGIGQEAIAATIRVAHDRTQTDLHGSVLVRNDRPCAAAAAALDALTRYLGRFRAGTVQRTANALPGNTDVQFSEPSEPPVTDAPDCGHGEPVAFSVPDTAERAPSAPSRSPAGFPAIGVVISSPGIHAAAIDSRGAVLAEAHRPVRVDADPEATLSQAVQAVREVIGRMDGDGEFTSIGLALRGQLAEDEGVCVSSGEFPEWRYVPVTAPFATEFGRPVAFLNPTHAAAYAEFSFGAARGIRDVLYARVGADIDIALILGGRPTLTQLPPGQAGHIVIEAGGPRCACGESGCWQALAGTDAFVARVVRALRSGTPSAVGAAVHDQAAAVTPALIVRMAASGDAVARRAVEETGGYLALGLANLIALFGPQAVIVESQPAAVGAALRRAAETSLKLTPRAGLLSHCVLLSPELGDSSTVIGAAAWAARNGS